jgi:hypothetical protein
LSDFIQIPGKIVVHFPNKWGRRERIPWGRFHREVREREWPEPKIVADCDLWRERRRDKERRRAEEERPNRTSISDIGALPCPKGSNEVGAFVSMWRDVLLQLDR